MTVEYRIARAEEMAAILYAQSLGFGASTAQDEIAESVATTLIRPEWRLCAFEDGDPVAQVCVVPTTMHWHGTTIAATGVTDVFTHPAYRRRGHLRQLMTRVFAMMRGAGQSVSILEASFAAIYQRFGWAVVYTGLRHDLDPRHLRFVDPVPVSGGVRLVPREQARAAIEPVYARFAANRTLTFERGDFEWTQALRLRKSTNPPLLVAVYEENGAPQGYAIYRVDERPTARPADPGQQISVVEWVWLTAAAHRGLIQFLAGYDLVDSLRLSSLPLDDPLLYQVEEPRGLSSTATDGALARIVDLQAALAAGEYSGTGRLVLGVEDEYAPWNSGAWELEVSDRARVRRVAAEPHIRLTPRVLAVLACGYQSASTLAHAGLIACLDPAALAVADHLFRTECVPFCLDHWM